ncbi:phycobilisome rod-core linker polypeptide [Vulcanococcus sp. Clear-D1]|jgi:phycobilisome rod-core linker protein|uniref:phycobilisome rod-core linker polypeptide n=1 Tax=Vulcanococcus sp. Clear-D1 TaxID=2766970 RepID=UPI00199B6BD0|nr:phycobilisome rod-core linker polypeptide [Vulcanococcus sp. Clear-D1]MBD1192760.1 phycobilisome rod-core linker polypeptide [Vulcanococcus sp. Clear-D1]
MALPLLATKPITQNSRVNNFSIGTDEAPRTQVDVEEQIERAYRQIFFHAFKVDREPMLEMQFRNGDLTAREFVRGLLLSRKFREGFYRCNSNYQVVEQIVGRVLGRDVHGDQERIAWSIVIANKGLEGFVDALLSSQEYMEAFGLETVPYQRSRVLVGHAKPQLPFNQKAPRYNAYWRDISARRAPANPFAGGGAQFSGGQMSPAWVGGQPPKLAQTIWLATAAIGTLEVLRVLLTSAGAMLGTGSVG